MLLPASILAEELKLKVDLAHPGEAIDLTRFALGQGGLSDKPMIDPHLEALAQLHPQTIRLFVQEFFDLWPGPGRYHWQTLDRAIETILATGAKPLLCLCFKPKLLYPRIDQKIVHPTDYERWDALIFNLVTHCNQEKKFGIQYWEIGNEVDIGEDGGCPYLFEPSDYVTYYGHTAKAILRADKTARIGGPALAGHNSEIGRVLMERGAEGAVPLDFFSWHLYSSHPEDFRQSIRQIKARLSKYPALENTETIIDEWNMQLEQPNLEPAFQPAFILETTLGFLEEGLTRSAYYHIRDTYVDPAQFAGFLSKRGAEFVARWWNVVPQYDGLWDHQGQIRPAYYAFKLLSLLRGQRLAISGTNSAVKALGALRPGSADVLIWNFPPRNSAGPAEVAIEFPGGNTGPFRLYRLDARRSLNCLELRRQGTAAGAPRTELRDRLDPYDILWLALDR